MRRLTTCLVAAVALGHAACRAATPKAPSVPAAADRPAYPGFGSKTTGGAGRPVFSVKTLADSGPGSLRDALALAARGGGTIRFAIGGGVNLASSLTVPGHTTIDGSSAPAPGITLWGEHTGARGTGVVNILESDVIVRGVRVRNGLNDGFHVATKNGHSIANIVIDHCSITNNSDGGIDVTGDGEFMVTDVTIIGNYLAGNGGPCAKGMCGGASLMKYRADRVSYYYNLWDKNLRRCPGVSGENGGYEAIADIRYNVVRSPEQSGIQIREGARANVVSNTLDGPTATIAIKLWGGHAYVRENPSDLEGDGDLAAPLPVPSPPPPRSAADVSRDAGAQPADAVDRYYMTTAKFFADVKAKTFAHGAAPWLTPVPPPRAVERPAGAPRRPPPRQR